MNVYKAKAGVYKFKTKLLEYQDGFYEPFVYMVRDIDLDIYYIGMKVAKGCLLSDLGSKYFTSSKRVKQQWIENPDSIEIVMIQACCSNHDAIILEGEMIKEYDAVNNDKFFNLYYPGFGFSSSGIPLTKERSNNMSKAQKKRFEDPNARLVISKATKRQHDTLGSPMKGKLHSEDTRKLMSDARKLYYDDNRLSDKARDRISAAQKRRFANQDHPKGFKGKKQKRKTCVYCGKTIAVNMYARYHGDKCKQKAN